MRLLSHILICLLASLALESCRKNETPDLPPVNPAPVIETKVDSSSFTIGNLEKSILDTFVVYYNKPVTVQFVRLLSNLCLPDLGFRQSNQNKTVRFYNLLCGRLGEEYKFELRVKDSLGNQRLDTVSFSYYTKKLAIEGTIIQFFLSQDNKYCWAITQSPEGLYKLGVEDNSVTRFSLNFKPHRFCFNPDNQRLYIVANPFPPNPENKIYVYNPANGMQEKVFSVQPDIYDDPQKHIISYELAFGNNGVGVINTGTVEYGLSRWRIINSRNKDSTYAHPAWVAAYNGTGNSHFREIVSVQPNFNGNKIYLRKQYALPGAGVLDCSTGILTELIYSSGNPNHYIVPSKKDDKLFVASYIFQSIYTPAGWINAYSSFDNRYSETADFSYRPGESNIIYYRGRDFSYNFSILDYNNARILTTTNVRPDFLHITATTDGKYIIVDTNGGLYLFSMELFYKYI